MSGSQVSTSPDLQPSPFAEDDERAHLVCCRDPAWLLGVGLKAFCGAEGDRVRLTAEVLCVACVQETVRLRPQSQFEVAEICPVDHRPCPDDMARAEMVARLVMPP